MNSDSTVAQIDELLREYLAFRGFTATLKTFEIERKNDKTKSYQVFKIFPFTKKD
jgi:WD repeat-containing protein 91